ncbi:hypothetical protein SADUNF_Sadunf05G0122200 [Salix dunnii]|uniref:Uncharacterized protein n=1 Tax=Salix dunnii TaxID=1413687 RepID=A0A835N286_9ROSI|nr:hypothetical protein SADUNF_Sadunf05G0122200 [Salix dunnii]
MTMRDLGSYAVYYLAAAVSDFYVPWKSMLETDSKTLLEKAEMALKKYRMHMVVANELSTCKEEVTAVTGNEKILVSRDKTQSDSDVEEPLIELTVGRHSTYVKDSDL